ncbi:palmitoyltransferase ZDHHC21-like [Ptychodera flava]|uniref:palmitoyltransferase ZDHHC21-like n=1 Tax=Ptychodera flava TaxID=63121 RepID=UPI00396A31C1
MNIQSYPTNQVSSFLLASQKSVPNIIKLPCGLSFVRDPEMTGYYCLGFIVFGLSYGLFIVPHLVVLPMYQQGQIGTLAVIGYFTSAICTLVSLFRSATSDPGRISMDLRPAEADKLNWTHCQKCFIQRPVNSHHCRRCGQCVRLMDHHCPWINNCVGEDNKWMFVLLVFYGAVLSFLALIFIICHFYFFDPCREDICDKNNFMFKHSRWFMYLAFVLDITLLLICFSQFVTQVVNIYLNRTTLEQIIESAKYYHYGQYGEPDEEPKHSHGRGKLTAYESFRNVWGSGTILCWMNPFRRRRATPQFVYNDQLMNV